LARCSKQYLLGLIGWPTSHTTVKHCENLWYCLPKPRNDNMKITMINIGYYPISFVLSVAYELPQQ
jgi:hypothetical protein